MQETIDAILTGPEIGQKRNKRGILGTSLDLLQDLSHLTLVVHETKRFGMWG